MVVLKETPFQGHCLSFSHPAEARWMPQKAQSRKLDGPHSNGAVVESVLSPPKWKLAIMRLDPPKSFWVYLCWVVFNGL